MNTPPTPSQVGMCFVAALFTTPSTSQGISLYAQRYYVTSRSVRNDALYWTRVPEDRLIFYYVGSPNYTQRAPVFHTNTRKLMKKLLLALSLLAGGQAFAGTDSLATNTFTMFGDIRERGMIGLKLDGGQSAVFNLTANCNTAQCAHGMAGIRLDQNGHMIHYQKFGHSTIDVDPIKAIWTTDKHILLVGIYGDDRILMKVDTMFNVTWARRVNKRQSYATILQDCLVELNGSYYMSFDNTFVKIKPDGTIVFSKIFGPEAGTTDDFKYVYVNTLTPLSNGRFFMGGGIDLGPDPWDGEKGFMMIADTNGVISKQKQFTIGAPYGEEISYAFKQSENKIRVFGHYDNDIYTAEVDSNLAMTNVKTVTGSNNAFTHTIHYNGVDQYVLGFTNQGITLVALDNNGTLDWAKSYAGGYSPYSIYSMNNCTYALYGSCNTNTPNYKKGYWMKVNSDGNSAQQNWETPFTPVFTNRSVTAISNTTAVDSGQWQTDFSIQNFLADNSPVSDSLWYRSTNPLVCPDIPQSASSVVMQQANDLCAPNPFYSSMQISNSWELNKISNLMVYDITGRVIYSEEQPRSRTINVGSEVSGLVFVKWMYEGQVYSQKMLAL
jgi:hypothetical protein